MTNNISIPQSAVVNHGGVEFANVGERHYVRAEGEWVCISKADYNMIVGRIQIEPNVKLIAEINDICVRVHRKYEIDFLVRNLDAETEAA